MDKKREQDNLNKLVESINQDYQKLYEAIGNLSSCCLCDCVKSQKSPEIVSRNLLSAQDQQVPDQNSGNGIT